MSRLSFKLEAQATGSRARAARFRTLHNEVLTPLFMPVGTHAAVRNQRTESLADSGSQILLANTYHLLLRPGKEVFEKFGGIHSFMKWEKSVLTDSGGFQIFAMPNDRVMSEEGAKFLSYVDGKHILLTPEKSIEMQRAIGSDIMMVLDQCVPSTVPREIALAAVELSNRWALRSLAARGESPQSMFAIVQGACYPDLRKISAEFLTQHPFDGFALGGLAVGESKAEREDTVEYAAALLPADLPRYLMGVGTPIDLLEAVHRGMDMFDCIIPTAHAEQGVAYTWKGKVLLRRGAYRLAEEPISDRCGCSTCQKYSRAYLHHLIKAQEHLGRQLIGEHNIYFYHELMRTMRGHIIADTFMPFYEETRKYLAAGDEEYPTEKVRPREKKPMVLGDFQVSTSAEGINWIQHVSSGEIMHPQTAPEAEAQALYVDQSRLRELAREPGGKVVVWDVGLGGAANAMAAIHTFERLAAESGGVSSKLEIYSFENDMNPLKLALKHLDRFRYLRHSAPNCLVERLEWTSKKFPMEWKLLLGNFHERVSDAPVPDIIFFDPFSYKTNPEMWNMDTFSLLQKICAMNERGAEVFTYSSSTAVRATLLAAGFFVAKGKSTPVKTETTIAFTAPNIGFRKDALLGDEWKQKWERSDAKWPLHVNKDEVLLHRIREHSQFRPFSS